MPEYPTQITLDRINTICERFEDDLQSNPDERPDISSYLNLKVGADQKVLFQHLLELEVDYRRHTGELPQRKEYYQHFEQYRDVIDSVFNTVTDDVGTMVDGPDSPRILKDTFKAQSTFSGYELIEVIGRGGMGVVYKARHRALNRVVALKMITSSHLDNDQAIERFYQEATAAAKLDHPAIVPVFDVAEFAGRHFYTMAYVKGASLGAILAKSPQEQIDAASILAEVADAIQVAHENGLIHRDLKPANILIDLTNRPKVVDFGLVKSAASSSDLTATGQILGTPSYMPPEQARGSQDVNHLVDVYAIGAVLYHQLTGRPPFQAATPFDIIRQVLEQEPVSPRKLSPQLHADIETICLKCLEKDPSRRYQSARDVANELRRFLNSEPIEARPVGRMTRGLRWCFRNPRVATLSGLAFVSMVVGTVLSSYFAVQAHYRAEEAEASTELAKQQTGVALEAIRTIVFDIDATLAEIPEAQKERRKILHRVTNQLSELMARVDQESTVTEEYAMILINLAEISLQLGSDGSRTNEEAAADLEKGATILEQIAASDPNPETLLRLAAAYRSWGDTHAEAGHNAKARAPLVKALAIMRELESVDPTNAHVQERLADILMLAGENAFKSNDPSSAITYFDDGIQRLEKLLSSNPHNALALKTLAGTYEYYGDLYRTRREFSPAREKYEKMLAASLRFLETDPEGFDPQWHLSVAYERMGMVDMATNNLTSAQSNFEEFLRWSLEATKRMEKGTYWDVELSYCYDQLGDVHRRLSNVPEAIEHYRKGIELRKPFIQRDHSNSRNVAKLVRNYRNLIDMLAIDKQHKASIEVCDDALTMFKLVQTGIGRNALKTFETRKTRLINERP